MMAVVERLAVVAGGVVAVAIEVVALVAAAGRIAGELLTPSVGAIDVFGALVLAGAVVLLASTGMRARRS